VRSLPLVLFDCLFLFFAVLIYGTSASAAVWVGAQIWGASIPSRGLAVVVGYFVFLHAFVIVCGVTKRLVQRPLTTGSTPIGMNKKYFAWALNSIFQGLFITSFFDRQIHIIFYLKWLYYRMMGMRLPFNAVIGTRAIIRQAELIELGDKVVLGEMSGLFGHISPDGKRHIQGRIRIGDRSLVGAYAMIGPGVTIGTDSIVGTNAILATSVRIGNKCLVGPRAYVGAGVRIKEGGRVLPLSFVKELTLIREGETWGGNPAVRIEQADTPNGAVGDEVGRDGAASDDDDEIEGGVP